jgi:hypothetical protein
VGFFYGLFSDAVRGWNMEWSYLIYLFIYDLCNDAVGSLDYVGPNGDLVNKWGIGHGVDGSGHDPFRSILSPFIWRN